MNVFVLFSDIKADEVSFANDEIEEMDYFSKDYINQNSEEFTPNFIYEYNRFITNVCNHE